MDSRYTCKTRLTDTLHKCCGSLGVEKEFDYTPLYLERILFLSSPSFALLLSFPSVEPADVPAAAQLDITWIAEPPRAFALHVFGKPPCTSSCAWSFKKFTGVGPKSYKVNVPRLHPCSACPSISYQVILYSSAKNTFHAQLPKFCPI